MFEFYVLSVIQTGDVTECNIFTAKESIHGMKILIPHISEAVILLSIRNSLSHPSGQ
jgi:hypothetical protein